MLLLDCVDEINQAKNIVPKLSHGFTRERSIITNAQKHVNQRYVLNIDLHDFFGSFNFGRVRGFFIKNHNFLLHDDIATVLAKISCLNNSLPQGSPCSPVITNLITHSLDIRLASLARRNSCIYSRYADDITFSTRDRIFPPEVAAVNGVDVVIGNALNREIQRAGFRVNESKTRMQFRDSRQDVTGLIVNKKINIKREYWRKTRAMCHALFTTGSYQVAASDGTTDGTIGELEGKLNFIDQIDRHHRIRPKGAVDHRYQIKNIGLDFRSRLNVREKLFSKFLYYIYFYAHNKPTILCEGKTDNIYLKSAIQMLCNQYPLLAKEKTAATSYELLVNFFRYSKKTRFLLDLYGGGTYLKKFVERYQDNLKYYENSLPQNPVILLLDNDSGPEQLLGLITSNKSKYLCSKKSKDEIRDSEFTHITSNLYLILTPKNTVTVSMMEDFFDNPTLSYLVDGRKFDASNDADTIATYGKNTFATRVVMEKKSTISFDGFKPILDRINSVIHHYDTFSAN
jgi:retron-type reverse transcriptase